ncbi:MAG: hypothetical protein HOW73_42930 [Polyangiaceae bacterium]|nr:hypothetical protein [Polyangiaceae bacterium]
MSRVAPPPVSHFDPLIGRDDVVRRIEALVASRPLVTLWGPAGIGKTRVASHIVRRALDDGKKATFVDLSRVRDGALVLSVIGHELGIAATRIARPGDRLPEAIGTAVRDAGIALVVLDNVEQIGAALAPALIRIMASSSPTHWLVTSRERLDLAGEATFELEPLALPKSSADVLEADATRLLLARAGGRWTDPASLSPDDIPVLFEIVRELEGVPLAIELAAGRMGSLGLRAVAERLPARLDLLGRGARGAPERQASARGAILWSWELLTQQHQRALTAMAVFRGSFAIDAACAVVHAALEPSSRQRATLPIDLVQDLRDKSLLRGAGDGRLAMSESVRAFAAERAADLDADVEVAHMQVFLALTRSGSPPPLSDRDNLMTAARTALDRSKVEHALELLRALDAIVTRSGPFGLHVPLLDRAITSTVANSNEAGGAITSELVAFVRSARGRAHAMAGRHAEAMRDLEDAVGILRASGPPGALAEALLARGTAALTLRDLTVASACYEEAVAVSDAAGDRLGAARARGNLAAVAHDARDFDGARRGYTQAIETLELIGASRLAAVLHGNLGLIDQELGHFAAARARFERAHIALEAQGDPRLLSLAIGHLGALSHEEGSLEAAIVDLERAARPLQDLGDKRSQAIAAGRLVAALADADRGAEARAVLDQARKTLSESDDRIAFVLLELAGAFIALERVRRNEGTNSALEDIRQRVATVVRCEAGRHSVADVSDDARTALRILAARLSPLLTARKESRILYVTDGARRFRIGDGDLVDLEARRSARLIVAALVDALERRDRGGLSQSDLFATGWPGERAAPAAVDNRVNVTLSFIRKAGLGPWLKSDEHGLFLDPSLFVLRVREL